MELIICFIDDSDFEHDIFRNEITPCAPELFFLHAYTFDDAVRQLGDRVPVLFLLDLWGQDPDVTQPSITPIEDFEKRISRFKTPVDVYEGLGDFKGDRNNEYLKRLFSIVDGWRKLFEDVCDKIGQNRKYGIANIRMARKLYPGVPAVFYTRKSLINDAVAIFHAGADGLFIKPTGQSDLETRHLTKNFGPRLAEELFSIIDSRIDQLLKYDRFYSQDRLPKWGSIEGLVNTWRHFRNN